jgi:hypothetical protein
MNDLSQVFPERIRTARDMYNSNCNYIAIVYSKIVECNMRASTMPNVSVTPSTAGSAGPIAPFVCNWRVRGRPVYWPLTVSSSVAIQDFNSGVPAQAQFLAGDVTLVIGGLTAGVSSANDIILSSSVITTGQVIAIGPPMTIQGT